jgi:hypothetical protein
MQDETGPAQNEKRCARCKEIKPLQEFGPSKGVGHKGLFPWCKQCKSAYQREQNALIPRAERTRRAKAGRARKNASAELRQRYLARHALYSLKSRYGITSEDVQELLEIQKRCCAICECSLEKQEGRKNIMHIDHDHATGRVRGLLCQCCNSGLGFFKDQEDLLRKAIGYLANPPNSRR